ncbi:HAD-IIB family hydrolase [Mycoplasma putrefaciens]|uniref:Hydrolase of the HAD family n=1 Tax=Mycoplasma putrefaciens Mput9231 TaxID=1292033 RepID=M9WGN6_9MOLU|nr:HAD-IIB family hydrolase [Mycoplasma putrefaciens]AGJ90564.1 Hypothetical protein, predicted hydrolase of the HAD family [Mycoplasma putrefaciens Mput9231]
MNKKIKLLILDMDGTSYHKMGPIIQDNIEPLNQIIDKGIEVVFVTGRSVLSKQNNLEKHGFTKNHTLIAGYNGACIFDLQTNKILASNPIKWSIAKQVYDLAASSKFKDHDIKIWGYATDLKTVVLSKSKDLTTDYDSELNLFDGKLVQFAEIDKEYDFFKLLAFNANKEFFETLKTQLKLNVSTDNNKIIEININGINKKFAVDWFKNHLNIELENIAAMGDGMNDYEMIKHVGIGVAFKNSVDALKEIAQVYIDKTSEQGAVKEFINNYILLRKDTND